MLTSHVMDEATIYARQSLDRDGEGAAVERQLDTCRKFAAERGWTVTAEFIDNDVSATNGAARVQFEALLASRPKRIVVWHTDRLVRLTKDLERVIELGVNVHAVKAGHLDLSNPAGRAVARTVTAWATYEGEQKAERQKASNDQRAAAGRPPAGRRLYGYTPDGMHLVEAEAIHTRQAVRQLLDGAPLRTLTRQMNTAGARTTAGNEWGATELRRYLCNPRIAGLRVHRGEVVGPGVWPPIIDEDEQVAVKAVLADPARRPKGRPRTYLLSGVARCGQCGARLYGRTERRGPIYVCEASAHLGRRIEPVDDFVEQVMVQRLAQPDAAHAFAVDPGVADHAAELRTERRTLTDRLDDLAEAFAAGEVTRAQLTKATATMRDRLDAIAAELPTLVDDPVVGELTSADDVADAWEHLAVDQRRSVIGLLADVTVHPPGRGARTFKPETVEITWRTP